MRGVLGGKGFQMIKKEKGVLSHIINSEKCGKFMCKRQKSV